MAWPTPSDYQDAVQNPQTAFSDPRLQSAQVALGPLGLPKVASGNYASVYELRSGSRRWAVRCFNRQVPDAQRRYRTIDEHLNRHPLPWLVGFDFLNEGVRVRGKWYPIVVMDWVEGVTLSRYLEKRVRDGAAVRALADQWPPMMIDLRAAQIAHGDLQHGNILVAQERFQLVDYDNLFVPAFQGEPSPELGRLHYQHPGRTGDDFDLDISNFSALVIYLSLRALAVDPSLWQTYNGENLVLTADDFKHPARSAILAQMRRSPDPEVPRLADELARCAALPVSQVPPLEAVLASVGITTTPGAAPRPAPVTPPAGSQPDWLAGAKPDASRTPAPPPRRQSGRRPPAPAPAPPGGGSWWEHSDAPPPPAQTGPRQPRPRRPGRTTTRPSPPANPGAGTVTLPRSAPLPVATPGGCLASLVRSCMIALLMLALLVGGIGWLAYQNWDRIGPIVNLPPITAPQDPGLERPAPDTAPPDELPGPDRPRAPEQLPNTVPRTAPARPEAEPPGPPGPPTRTEPRPAPTTPAGPPAATAAKPAPTSPAGPAAGTQAKPAPTSPPRALELLSQATTRLQAGDPEGAIDTLAAARKAGLNLQQDDVARRYYATVAEARYRAGQYLLSLGAFRQALRLDPENERLRTMFRDSLRRLAQGREGREAGM
jgi:hypothetical protein